MKDIHHLYLTEAHLSEIHHLFDTNRNKLFNKLVTKFVPKTSYMCRSICGKGRVYIAAGVDSVGYRQYYNTLYDMLGIRYTDSHYNLYTTMDRNREY